MTKLTAIFLAGLIALIPLWASAASENLERIMAAKEIRCGYATWNPILYKDLNSGEIQGISKELMDAVGKKMDVKVTWAEEAAWGSIVEGLLTKRYDMICTTLGALTSRALAVDFSEPVFYLPIWAVSRIDDTRFDKDISGLDDPQYKIGVLEGEGTSIFARLRYPNAQTVAIPQVADVSLLMEDIKTGKSDISFISAETFDAYNKKNPGILKIANSGKPIMIAPVAFGIPKGDYEVKRLMDIAIEELYGDGIVEQIFKKYDPEGKLFLLRNVPYKQ
ncbi:MAG TPA: transporter substrate-binding domain-containing protein [Alphaproteobacteria bacterium]|nr:transporter substrate-binding domain-containing protein [Alphaproteobacteria bacterium]HNS44844.1 transporter substrate-binding domain-containing protein [Alphaproteobacteria bacterium]